MYISCTILGDVENSGNSSVIIGGAMGGVILLLMITVVLCIVILCMRRCHRKRTFPVESKVHHNVTKLNTDVGMEYNPSYGVARKDHNAGSSVYNVPAKPYGKVNEDEITYAQPDQFHQVQMCRNPSYGVRTGKSRATNFSATVTNSDTIATAHQSCMTKQYDYGYVHSGSVHNATDDAKENNIQILANIDQGYTTRVSRYIINQLQTDNNDICDITTSQQSDNVYL